MSNKTVLVVDTDTETIQLIMSGLESEGYLVFTVSEKDVSIKMAKKINPSLIFVNIGMSGTSGLEICKAIHDDKSLKDIPIIIITPHEGELDDRHKTDYGIVDSLKKPFNKEELIAKTSSVLDIETEGEEDITIVQPIKEEVTVEPIEEEIEIMPLEEEVTIKPSEEEFDMQILEEEKVDKPIEEEIQIESLEDEISAQLTDEEIDMNLLGEEQKDSLVEKEVQPGLTEEEGIMPIEEEMDLQPFEEEEFKVKPAEEELHEEETDKGKESEIPELKEEEVSKIQEEVPEKQVLEEAELTEMLEEADIEETKQVAPEKPVAPEEPVSVSEKPAYKKRDSLYRGVRRKSDKGSKLLIPVVAIALIILIGGGFLLYKVLMKEPQIQRQTAQIQPPDEQSKPSEQVERRTTRTAPTPAPVKAVSPQAKSVYAVQLGAYKNRANATALVQKYKRKGYDAFIKRTITADKGTLYKVLIGKFESRNKAIELSRRIRNKENISTIIFHGKV